MEERGAVQEESGEKRMSGGETGNGGDSWSSLNRCAWLSVYFNRLISLGLSLFDLLCLAVGCHYYFLVSWCFVR